MSRSPSDTSSDGPALFASRSARRRALAYGGATALALAGLWPLVARHSPWLRTASYWRATVDRLGPLAPLAFVLL